MGELFLVKKKNKTKEHDLLIHRLIKPIELIRLYEFMTDPFSYLDRFSVWFQTNLIKLTNLKRI